MEVSGQTGSKQAKSRWRSRVGGALVGLWVAGTLVPVSALMAGHLLTLPTPTGEAALARLSQGVGVEPTWRVLHVLARRCACSGNVMDSLLERGPKAGFTEKVLLIGEDAAW